VIYDQNNLLELDHHPVCAQRTLRGIFFIAHPPLLGEEGNVARNGWATRLCGRGYVLSPLRGLELKRIRIL
jgi:hypothetical protein